MAIRGVLTGDLINYRNAASRRSYTETLRKVLNQLAEFVNVRSQNFRGDGFQVVPRDPARVVLCAVLVRAGLIGASPDDERWDARVSVGVGRADEEEGDDGEAFILSGLGLDKMRSSTMSFHTKIEGLGENLELATTLAMVIVDDWTPVEAKTYFTYRLQRRDRDATAAELGKATPTVSRALMRGHAKEMDAYIMQARKWIRERDDD
jgi:hypothetical protein